MKLELVLNAVHIRKINYINIRQVIYENQMKMIEQELTPFGFYDDGQHENHSGLELLK